MEPKILRLMLASAFAGALVGAVVVGVALVARDSLRIAPSGSVSPRHSLGGSIAFTDRSSYYKNPRADPCGPESGYPDIAAGAAVVLKDDNGKTIATGALRSPVQSPGSGTGYFRCLLAFTLPDVPEVPFYSVEVSRRGALTFSLADMKAQNWSITLSLGQ